jgi:hypothetical protein
LEDCRAGLLHPVVSDVVWAEVSKAPAEVVDIYERLLASDPTVLSVTEETLLLADTYCERGIVSEQYRNDVLHIAIATVGETDILVSWNFRHIVRYDRIRRFNGVSIELGYRPVDIRSPREVVSHGAQDS